jgi:uncharacterized protein with GYD domain
VTIPARITTINEGGCTVPLYLLQYAYTPDAWSKMLGTVKIEVEKCRELAGKLGGSVTQAWVTFGEYDVAAIVDLPDNVTAGALSVALSAAGLAKAAKTTPLIAETDGQAILRKAKAAGGA